MTKQKSLRKIFEWIIIYCKNVARDNAPYFPLPSSVARGGLELPHWLVKYAKSHVFNAFEADFLWKIENSPPLGKTAPLKRLNLRNWTKNQSQFRRRPFFFFLETTWFWAEKNFEFPRFPRNFVWIFGQTVWNWFKNNANSGQGRLHFSHSFKIAPPFPNPGYAPAPTWTKSLTTKI